MKVKDREWPRLRARIYRQGPVATAHYVSTLVRAGKYPTLWYPHQFVDYMLKRGELEAAEIVLKTTRRYGEKHFLMDMLQSRWLWDFGKRKAAIRFTLRKAKYWSNSCLYHQLSAMHRVNGNQRKAEEYLQISRPLARKEIAAYKRKRLQQNKKAGNDEAG